MLKGPALTPVPIQDRCLAYALRAIRLVQFLHKRRDSVAPVIAKQYLRSATSIGANLAEAQAGETRADFIHKLAVAQKEARESKYWLNLLLKAELVRSERLLPLLDETDEVIAVLTTILVKTKRNGIKQRAIQNSAFRIQN